MFQQTEAKWTINFKKFILKQHVHSCCVILLVTCCFTWAGIEQPSLAQAKSLTYSSLHKSYLSSYPHRTLIPTIPEGIHSLDGPSVVRNCGPYGPTVSYVGQDHHLHIYSTNNGGKDTYLALAANYGPASACYSDKIWEAWSYATLGNTLSLGAESPSGGGIIEPIPVETVDGAPALVVCNNILYIGWVGTDASHHLNIMQWTNNVSRPPVTTLTDYTRSGAGLSLACLQGTLYVAWIASSGTPHLYLGAYTGSNQLNPTGQIGQDSSDHHPSISPNPTNSSQLEIFFKGNGNTYLNTAYYTPSTGTYVGPTVFVNASTPYAPAVDDEATAYIGTDQQVNYDSGYFFP